MEIVDYVDPDLIIVELSYQEIDDFYQGISWTLDQATRISAEDEERLNKLYYQLVKILEMYKDGQT